MLRLTNVRGFLIIILVKLWLGTCGSAAQGKCLSMPPILSGPRLVVPTRISILLVLGIGAGILMQCKVERLLAPLNRRVPTVSPYRPSEGRLGDLIGDLSLV